MLKRIAFVLMVLLLFPAIQAQAQGLRIGVLPVLDTLPLRVAVQDGYFAKQGLDVTLVPFSSAMERDTAMASGNLDGYFGDMVATLTLLRAGVPMQVVTVCYDTVPGRRMFALVASPKGMAQGANLGYSSTTIMEFLLDLMAPNNTINNTTFTRMEIKKIPIRMQMLLSGQLGCAILPEPLVSLVESRGGTVLATDAKLHIPLTVICLSKAQASAKKAFLTAYAQALDALAKHPEAYRELMVTACRVPKALAATFPLPQFPKPHLPSAKAVNAVQTWMLGKGLLQKPLTYAQVVGN